MVEMNSIKLVSIISKKVASLENKSPPVSVKGFPCLKIKIHLLGIMFFFSQAELESNPFFCKITESGS